MSIFIGSKSKGFTAKSAKDTKRTESKGGGEVVRGFSLGNEHQRENGFQTRKRISKILPSPVQRRGMDLADFFTLRKSGSRRRCRDDRVS